jgi:hypothetical protein
MPAIAWTLAMSNRVVESRSDPAARLYYRRVANTPVGPEVIFDQLGFSILHVSALARGPLEVAL